MNKVDTAVASSKKNVKNNENTINLNADIEKEKSVLRKYKATDLIPCVSIIAGELGMIGIKTKNNYIWNYTNDVVEVEYQDLVAGIRSNSDTVMKPYIIVQDNDFVEQQPQLQKLYSTMYSKGDLRSILNLSSSQIKTVVSKLPEGAKEAMKNIAATQITNGQLDSVKKIQLLDELLGTELILLTGLFKR